MNDAEYLLYVDTSDAWPYTRINAPTDAIALSLARQIVEEVRELYRVAGFGALSDFDLQGWYVHKVIHRERGIND